MVYMLFDNPADENNMGFLKNNEATSSYALVFPQEKCNSIKSMYKACKNAIASSNEGDTLIFWYDLMGVICQWYCKFFHKKRKIVILNILLKDKKTLKNRIAKFLYKHALKSPNVKATVTSVEYGEMVRKMLGINQEFILLHDIYYGNSQSDYSSDDKSVFCGGRNGRDWKFLFELAGEMPDVKFNVVLSSEQLEIYKDKIKDNINVKADIPMSEFLNIMSQSSLVALPIDTEAPAGLIVMFQAASCGKMVITSDTVTTREYFGEQRGEMCKHEIVNWKEKIYYWLDHQEESKKRAESFRSFLETECSRDKYAETLSSIVES